MSGDLDKAVVKAAILAAQGKNQMEIAQALGDYSQSGVSRLLKMARDDLGILLPPPSMAPTLIENKIPPDLYRQAEEELRLRQSRELLESQLHRAIAEYGGKPVFQRARIIVAPQPQPRTKSGKEKVKDKEKDKEKGDSWQQRGEIIGRAAAERFVELLDAVKLVGILHGRTIKGMVDVAEHLAVHDPPRPGVRFVPLSGEPFFLAQYDPQLTATELCMKLSRLVHKHDKVDEPILLRPVPAVVPKQFADEMNTIERLAEMVPAYVTIFGERPDPAKRQRVGGVVSSLDLIVTGVAGVAKEYLQDPWFRARLDASGLTMKEYQKYIAGDISGITLQRDDLGSSQEQKKADALADTINEHWLGVRLNHLQGCAERAAHSKRPGVLVIAHGASKARVLVEAIRTHGCISEILIDDELMQAMLKELAKRGPRRRHRA